MPVLAAFLKRHDEVELELSTENRLVDVLEGGFDLVIGSVWRSRRRRWSPRSSARIGWSCAAHPGICSGAVAQESPLDLVRHNCLHYTLVGREAGGGFGATRGRCRSRCAGT